MLTPLCELFLKLDLVGGGNVVFQKAVQWLRTELEFGTWEQSRFRFRGRELCQDYNRKSIKISMSKFAQEMEPVAVPKHVKDDLDATLEANVHSQFRGGVGQLQWLQLQGNPLLLFATGILQSRSATIWSCSASLVDIPPRTMETSLPC